MNSSPPAEREVAEATVMTVWPTVAATRIGRRVGQWCAIKAGVGFLTVGNLLALATIPITLTVYFWQLMPYVCRRYRLTNRRIGILNGLRAAWGDSIELEAVDSIDIEVLPGQDWYHAGDLVFHRGGDEVLRLPGVSRPESFRQVCLKTRNAVTAVRRVLQQQSVAAESTSV